MLLYRASRPYIAMLGRRASGEFGDMSRHADARPIPGLVGLRLDAPLYFFNANVARSQILEQVGSTHPRAVLLDLGASADLDIGTSDMLRDLVENLRRNEVDLLLAQVRGSVRNRMRLTGLFDSIGEDHVFLSIVAAVRWFETNLSEAKAGKAGALGPEGVDFSSPDTNRVDAKETEVPG